MSLPGIYNLFLEQDVAFYKKITWKSGGLIVPLSLYTAQLKIRDTDLQDAYILQLSETSGIQLANTSPNITITITKAQTTALNFKTSKWFLDLFPPAGGLPVRLLKGEARVEVW
jgi:hypothetical protein